MGPFKVKVARAPENPSVVVITVKNQAGETIAPQNLALRAEYVAQNVPFAPLPLAVYGDAAVGQVPVHDKPYTVQVVIDADGSTYRQKFFIRNITTQEK